VTDEQYEVWLSRLDVEDEEAWLPGERESEDWLERAIASGVIGDVDVDRMPVAPADEEPLELDLDELWDLPAEARRARILGV
jgi:hypothetical protein